MAMRLRPDDLPPHIRRQVEAGGAREIGRAGRHAAVGPIDGQTAVFELETSAVARKVKGLGATPRPGPRKYRNEPAHYDSPLVGPRTYDSRGEARYAAKLDAEYQAGRIRWWLPQVPIPLGASTAEGRQRRMMVDFLVCLADGTVEWRDFKGRALPEWRLKADLVRQRYGIEVKVVR